MKRALAIIWALIRSRLHCLFHFHRPIDIWVDGQRQFCGCECGRNYLAVTVPILMDLSKVLRESFYKGRTH